MIIYEGVKVTATELAKMLVEERGALAQEFWYEFDSIEHAVLTERESKSVQEALDKQADRVRRLLNWWDLKDELRARPKVR